LQFNLPFCCDNRDDRVLQVEFLKVVACLVYLFITNNGLAGLYDELKAEIIDKPIDSVKLLVPSLLYVVQNNLLFVAVSNLDPGTYQVTSQLKTLVTALFAVIILGVSPCPFASSLPEHFE
jgi:UDP-sugar transporter A1/2/3